LDSLQWGVVKMVLVRALKTQQAAAAASSKQQAAPTPPQNQPQASHQHPPPPRSSERTFASATGARPSTSTTPSCPRLRGAAPTTARTRGGWRSSAPPRTTPPASWTRVRAHAHVHGCL